MADQNENAFSGKINNHHEHIEGRYEVYNKVSAGKTKEVKTCSQSGKNSLRKLSAAEVASLGISTCKDTAGPSSIRNAESFCVPGDSNELDVGLQNELLNSSVLADSALIDIPIYYELPEDNDTKLTDVSQVENLSVIGDTNFSDSKLFGLQRLLDIRAHPWCLPNAPPCTHCGAARFYREPPGFCCSNGQVCLSTTDVPDELRDLFLGSSQLCLHFRAHSRTYNNTFAFTSFGVTYDKELCHNHKNVYTFRVQGQVYHFINALIPSQGNGTNLQLYFHDVENEVANRLAVSDKLERELILMIMKLLEVNPYSKFFQSLREQANLHECKIVLRANPALDQRTYNIPTVEQVAAIWKDSDNPGDSQSRDIRVYTKSGRSQKVEYYYGCYDPLQYPLLFPFGQPGWHVGIPRKKPSEMIVRKKRLRSYDSDYLADPTRASSADDLLLAEAEGIRKTPKSRATISAREYYCYKLQMRSDDTSMLLHSDRLFQQYLNDMYIKVETQRLDYFRVEQRQKNARIESLQGIIDSLGIYGENDPNKIGQRIFLPASFIGGPRDMHKRYIDAMTLVQKYGKPDIFLTMTCNPNWPEVITKKLNHEIPQNRPNLLVRAFRARLEELKDELINKKIFGEVVAYTYVLEFQKRGLPHAHWLLIMKDRYKIRSPEAYDRFISAELPDKIKQPYLYLLVVKHMMHGPCGQLNKNNVCMRDGKCKNHYPKEFCDITSHGKNAYPNYRRRDDGKNVLVRKKILDNRWVVPYCPYLLAKFDCHINVEICSDIKLVKYLYKYIYKGHDRVAYNIVENASSTAPDEIKQFQSGRWIAAPESAWRLFGFSMSEIHPSVISLQLHIPNYQYVSFKCSQSIEQIVSNPMASKTMLTEFFAMNAHDERAKRLNLLYREFPEYFVWNAKDKFWSPRKRGTVIGRIVNASPIEGERYYLRVLLQNIRGPTSFDSLKTVNGVYYDTFRDAAANLGLLDSDESLEQCLEEAAHYQMPYSLRRLFSTILVYCSPANPKKLWLKFKKSMSEDFNRCQFMSDHEIEVKTLEGINEFLETLGRSLKEFGLSLFYSPSSEIDKYVKELNHEKNIEIPEADLLAIKTLNDDQKFAFKTITEKIYSNASGIFFVDGPGGSGKTFLYRALLADVRSKGNIALAVATSGVAAALLPGGRTAHSRFKIPIDIDGKTKCRISKQTALAKLLLSAKLIVWDEISMARRQLIEALDDILQDLTGCTIPFGGKVVVFGGDYRQIAPVIVGGKKEHMIDASFVSSQLACYIHRLVLKENMRAKQDPLFADFLLRIGNGIEPYVSDDKIRIPDDMILPFVDSDRSLNNLIELVFPSLDLFLSDPSSIINRSILAPKNDCVDEINQILIEKFPGEPKLYVSLDKARDPSHQGQYEDFLNSITTGGLPPHILTLKVGCPIILLRNINPVEGLCNGTRLICRSLGEKVIHAEIATGHFRGKDSFIPRIPLESSDKRKCPIPFTRTQFPVKPCFALTINKAQGQTLDFVGIYLREPVFSHGQLYVALSQAKTGSSVKILIHPPTVEDEATDITRNIVYKEILQLANQE